jgi:hypothetical protein
MRQLACVVFALLAPAAAGQRPPPCRLDLVRIPPLGSQGRAWLRALPVGCDAAVAIRWTSSSHQAVPVTFTPKGDVVYVMGINGAYRITARSATAAGAPITGETILVLGDTVPLVATPR